MLASADRAPTSFARPGILFSILAALTIMPTGFNLALPGSAVGGWWTEALEVFHGVFVNDVMTFLWMAVAVALAAAGMLRPILTAEAKRYSALIAFLGVVGLISTITNSFRYSAWIDLGEVARLFVSAFYFLLMFHWAAKYGPGYVMAWFLGGIGFGGLINIYFSITAPTNTVGILPFLYNRNGAGGILALSIALAAWAWLVSGDDATIGRLASGFAAMVGVVAVALSFSKTSMVIGSLGVVAWMFALRLSPWAVLRSRAGKVLVLAAVVGMLMMPAGRISSVWTSIKESVASKFTDVLSPEVNASVRDRLGYYAAVWEIVSTDPINAVFGVGFSGFYPAVIQTQAFAQGFVDEEPGAGKLANPHNSYLYYIAELGLTGFGVIAALYWLFVRAVFRSVRDTTPLARAVSVGVALAYLLYASALPSLFKTEVLYLPAAVAMAAVWRART